MRSERRATRNRVYSLVGALLTVVLCIIALASFAHVGRRVVDERLYSRPDRTLIALGEAQERFRMHDLDEDGQQDYASSLLELEAAGQITRTLAEGDVHGYRYELRLDGDGYVIVASPDVAQVGTAALFYSVDRFQVVRAAQHGPPGPDAATFWHPVYGHELWPYDPPAPLLPEKAEGE